MWRAMWVSAGLLLLIGTLWPGGILGCVEGGANFHQQTSGNNNRGGIDLEGRGDPRSGVLPLGYGEIAVAPDGSFFLSKTNDLLIYGDLRSGAVGAVPGVSGAGRVAFAHRQRKFYITSTDGVAAALDADSLKILWRVDIPPSTAGAKMYASADDRRLVIVHNKGVLLLDAASGRRISSAYRSDVLDVDFTPDGATLLLTLTHTFKARLPNTRVLLLNAHDGTLRATINVPNCSSHLTLTPDGKRGFIAPTTCSEDPISVIDIPNARWRKNLPGFGPVALADDGRTAVAFMDAHNVDRDLFDDAEQIPSRSAARYHLMLLDYRSLTFDSIPVGDELPRYAITTDGEIVVVDSGRFSLSQRVRLLDMASRVLQDVTGPHVSLDHFAMHPASSDVYLLDQYQLYRLSLQEQRVRHLYTPFDCKSLNITPNGDHLLLLDEDGTLHLYNIKDSTIVHSMKPPSPTW